MLVSSQLIQVPTVERLVDIWANRYLPDLSILPIGADPSIRRELRDVSSKEGRAKTAAKLPKALIEENCKLAALRTKDLYTHLPEGCDLKEAIHLAQFSSKIYIELLEVYQESSPVVRSTKEALWQSFGGSSLSAWGIPKIDKLASTLEPLLIEFQEQHVICKDWRAIGFITTQICLSNALLLEQLTPIEQVFINPYFKFLEEQVALPWQRVCAAAAKYVPSSPAFILVEQMLPKASEISMLVYTRLSKSFPAHHGRRGSLNNQAVRHSCLRDLSMFQAYLWLCVLQGSLNVAEHELVALCIMVLESVGVPWEMTAKGTELLIEEMLNHLEPSQKALFQPYAQGMVKTFSKNPTYAQSV